MDIMMRIPAEERKVEATEQLQAGGRMFGSAVVGVTVAMHTCSALRSCYTFAALAPPASGLSAVHGVRAPTGCDTYTFTHLVIGGGAAREKEAMY